MSEKCQWIDCGKPFYKILRVNGGDVSYCKKHYFQFGYTDKAIKKIKKYWIIPLIIIALVGLFTNLT